MTDRTNSPSGRRANLPYPNFRRIGDNFIVTDSSGPTPVPILVTQDLLDRYLEYSRQLCIRRNSLALPPQPAGYTTVARAFNVNDPAHRFSEIGPDGFCILSTFAQPDLLQFYGTNVPEDERAAEAAERQYLNLTIKVLARQRIHEVQRRRQKRTEQERTRELAYQERLRVAGHRIHKIHGMNETKPLKEEQLRQPAPGWIGTQRQQPNERG